MVGVLSSIPLLRVCRVSTPQVLPGGCWFFSRITCLAGRNVIRDKESLSTYICQELMKQREAKNEGLMRCARTQQIKFTQSLKKGCLWRKNDDVQLKYCDMIWLSTPSGPPFSIFHSFLLFPPTHVVVNYCLFRKSAVLPAGQWDAWPG